MLARQYWKRIKEHAAKWPEDWLDWLESSVGPLLAVGFFWYALGRERAVEEVVATALYLLAALVCAGIFLVMRLARAGYRVFKEDQAAIVSIERRQQESEAARSALQAEFKTARERSSIRGEAPKFQMLALLTRMKVDEDIAQDVQLPLDCLEIKAVIPPPRRSAREIQTHLIIAEYPLDRPPVFQKRSDSGYGEQREFGLRTHVPIQPETPPWAIGFSMAYKDTITEDRYVQTSYYRFFGAHKGVFRNELGMMTMADTDAFRAYLREHGVEWADL